MQKRPPKHQPFSERSAHLNHEQKPSFPLDWLF